VASITKLKDRTGKPWQVRIRRKGQTFVEYFRTKKEADAFAAKVEADFDRWSKVLNGELRRHTLAELIDRYLTIWTGKDHSLVTRLAWWEDRFGDRPLSEFTRDTVREAMAAMEAEPASRGGWHVTQQATTRTGSTLNRYKAALSACYKTGIDRGWFGLKDNPFQGVRDRKEGNNRFGRALEEEARARLLAACDQSTAWRGLGVFVRLALTTGARRGELFGLEWRDVDLKDGSILLSETKNGDDRRVPLIGEARDRLAAWSKVRKLDDPRVFPGAKTTTTLPVDKAWTQAKIAAAVENLRIHDLRHS
jgi:integrase